MGATEKNVGELIAALASPNQKSAAAASADLASLIWAGKIDDSTLIAWLVEKDEDLRKTASWAIWDLGGPAGPLSRLMEFGPEENNDSVRLYCLRALIDYYPAGDRRRARITLFCEDECASIRERALRALETEENTNS